MVKKIAYTIVMLSALGCGKVKQIDTSEIQEVMRNSKVKRITEKQLLERISEIGEDVSERFNGNYALECQRIYDFPDYRVEMYNRDEDSSLVPEGRKKELLEAYRYGLANGLAVGVNVQKLNDTLYAYSFPLKGTSYHKTVCKNDFALVLIAQRELVLKL